MSSVYIREYNEMEVLRDFLLHMTGFARARGLGEKRWHESFVSEVIAGNPPWLISGQVVRRSFHVFPEPVFRISIRLGWQEEDGETRRFVYWSLGWKDSPSYNFGSLKTTIEETMGKLACQLGKDGVIFEPSPEQLVHSLFGEKKTRMNGSGRHHTVEETEALKLPS